MNGKASPQLRSFPSAPIKPTDSSMGLYLLLGLKGLLHQSLGREGKGWMAGVGDRLMFPNIVLSLILPLRTTLRNPCPSPMGFVQF